MNDRSKLLSFDELGLALFYSVGLLQLVGL